MKHIYYSNNAVIEHTAIFSITTGELDNM